MRADSGWTDTLAVGDEVFVFSDWRRDDGRYEVGTVAGLTATQVKINSRSGNHIRYYRSKRGREGAEVTSSDLYRAHIYPANDENRQWLISQATDAAVERHLAEVRQMVRSAAVACPDTEALKAAHALLVEATPAT